MIPIRTCADPEALMAVLPPEALEDCELGGEPTCLLGATLFDCVTVGTFGAGSFAGLAAGASPNETKVRSTKVFHRSAFSALELFRSDTTIEQ